MVLFHARLGPSSNAGWPSTIRNLEFSWFHCVKIEKGLDLGILDLGILISDPSNGRGTIEQGGDIGGDGFSIIGIRSGL